MERFELTAQQVQILNMQLADPKSGNTVCCDWNIGKSIEADALKSALNSLVDRHLAFRVRIVRQDGCYYQEMKKRTRISLEEISLAPDEYDAWVKSFTEARLKLDAVPFKFVLADVGGEYHLLIKIHHIICDAVSINVIVNDIKNLYFGRSCQGEILYEYFDYVKKSEAYSKGKRYEIDKEYWREQIDVDNVRLLLPEQNNCTVARIEKHCDNTLMQGLNAQCEENKITMVALLYFAFALNYSVLTSSDNFYLGTPLSIREAEQENTAVGMLSNLVPLKINLNRDRSALYNIKRVNSSFVNAFKHRNFNCSDYMKELGKKVGYNGAFFDVSVNYYKSECDDTKLYVSPMCSNALCIDLQDTGSALHLTYNYNSQALDKQEIERLNEGFIEILGLFAGESIKKPIGKLQVMNGSEENQAAELAEKESAVPKGKTIVDLFEERVRETPDDVAVNFDGESLSFSQLNEKSNQLARALRKMRIQPGDYVLIFAKPSMETVIAAYAVLKSGGAYIPVDTECSKERIKYILKDIKPGCILTYGIKFPVKTAVPVIELNDKVACSGAFTNPKRVNKSSDCAYVIYDKDGEGKLRPVSLEHGRVLKIAACDDRRMLLNTLSDKNANIYFDDIAASEDGENGVIIGDGEKKQKNKTKKTLVELFEDNVKKNPDDVAVAFGKEKLTYSELNAKSNQLARKLRKLGIEPGDFVMILARSGIERVTAVYAVLKSGGAYVSVGDACSKEEFRYILKDIKPKCILACGVKPLTKTSIPVIDLADKSSYSGAFTNPERVNKPCDVAYVKYLADATQELDKMTVEHGEALDFVSYNRKKIFQPLL